MKDCHPVNERGRDEGVGGFGGTGVEVKGGGIVMGFMA